jgi:hypothetical protein
MRPAPVFDLAASWPPPHGGELEPDPAPLPTDSVRQAPCDAPPRDRFYGAAVSLPAAAAGADACGSGDRRIPARCRHAAQAMASRAAL